MVKIERLFNLIALLLGTERHLTAADIRGRLGAYRDQSDEAFHRMFERDKVEIRELGYAIDQRDTDAWGGEVGYRISRSAALLDDPGFTPEEIAALSLSGQAWESEGSDGALGSLKLSVDGPGPGSGPAGWLVPRVAVDRNMATLIDALARRVVARFRYRTGGGGSVTERTVEPHGLAHQGAWYLEGFDRDRGELRRFKLSRIVGAIKLSGSAQPEFDAPPPRAPDVRRGPWQGEAAVEARIAFGPEVAWWCERRTGAQRVGERDDGWIEMSMPVADPDAFPGWIAGFGDRAEVIGPQELRDEVIAHLRAILGVT